MSGFNPQKPLFEDSENSDESFFLTPLVPLSLEYLKDPSSPTAWKNPRTCPPKKCVLVRFEYAEETKSKISLEFGNIDKQIKRLKSSQVEIDGIVYFIEHEMIGTMIDVKLCQHLNRTSSSANCTICHAIPSDVNNNSTRVLKNEENKEAFKFTLQLFHSWIRLIECILNIGY